MSAEAMALIEAGCRQAAARARDVKAAERDRADAERIARADAEACVDAGLDVAAVLNRRAFDCAQAACDGYGDARLMLLLHDAYVSEVVRAVQQEESNPGRRGGRL